MLLAIADDNLHPSDAQKSVQCTESTTYWIIPEISPQNSSRIPLAEIVYVT